MATLSYASMIPLHFMASGERGSGYHSSTPPLESMGNEVACSCVYVRLGFMRVVWVGLDHKFSLGDFGRQADWALGDSRPSIFAHYTAPQA
ncbi:hypothetical protein QL285_080599 [Trifolium repens]|nr:hypothetical protein QL285_080599 [Trifolium repens]